MPKSKHQKQEEARERNLANMGHRKQSLLYFIQDHYEDQTNGWTFRRLKETVEGFYQYLKECGLPHDDHAFYIKARKGRPMEVILRDPKVFSTGGKPYMRCVYCFQEYGTEHKGLCGQDVVGPHEALFAIKD